MKTVSGRVTSSKPVTLSKAARSLAKFVSSDNGASPAFAAYLKRTSASFDELVQLHKELKGSASEFKGKKKHFSNGIFTDDTVNSVKKPSHNGFVYEEKHGATDRTKQSSEGNVRRNVGGHLDDSKETTKTKIKTETGSSEQKSTIVKSYKEEGSDITDPNDGDDDRKESRKRKHRGSDN